MSDDSICAVCQTPLVMTLCTIAAPATDNAAANGRSKPILSVKYLGQVQCYATYRSGVYEFHLAQDLGEAIRSGDVVASYQLDDDEPVGILLKNSE